MDEIEEFEEWRGCGESKRCTYEISNFGRVKRVTKKNKIEKVLKGGLDKNGYLHVVINKTRLVHHLVVYAFIGPRPEGLEIDHIDRNKLNNRVDNLRYCTRSENNINKENYRIELLETSPTERIKILTKHRNKERLNTKINCICGRITSKSNKSTHEKSNIHQNWLANNP